MEFKEAPEELKPYVERAQAFWEKVDIDKMQPIVLGPVPSAEEMAERAQRLEQIQELQKQFFLTQMRTSSR